VENVFALIHNVKKKLSINAGHPVFNKNALIAAAQWLEKNKTVNNKKTALKKGEKQNSEQ
jgi:hypothetical protein